MNRVLLKSTSFIKNVKRLNKKNKINIHELQSTFDILSEDAFHPILKTHKLKGELDGSWACSVGYDLRIVF